MWFDTTNSCKMKFHTMTAGITLVISYMSRIGGNWAQRKIPVDLHFIVRLRHKASGAALGLSCAVCFEQPTGVFAGCGAVCQAKILASLKIKNGISLTPLN